MSTPNLVTAARIAGVRDERLLRAVRDVARSQFVPAGEVSRADIDRPLPIGHEQVTTQPSLVAVMVEALEVQPSDRVLEIGTGYGYQTALLARLAALVHSVERHTELAEAAVANLRDAGIANVEVTVGDGTLGLPDDAPFDGIVVAAAHPRIPPPLVEQLRSGGRLVQPVGPGGHEEVVCFQKEGDELVRVRALIGACFVRLFGTYGFDDGGSR